MRLAALSFLVLASAGATPAIAAQVFSCGGAEVRIEVLARHSAVPEERVEAVVTVSRNRAETVLRYREIDYIGGQCVSGRHARPLVAFQAYCGGSGCQDLANWGVVDPQTLRVLAVPNDANRAEVQKLVGGEVLPKPVMLNLVDEARRQGVEIF